MQEQISALKEDITARIDAASDLAALEDIRVAALGKKGSVSELMKGLGRMSPKSARKWAPRSTA